MMKCYERDAIRKGSEAPKKMRIRPQSVNRIIPHIDSVQLQADLESFCQQAGAAGAVDVAVIDATEVIFDEEIRKQVEIDNRYPSIHWPLNYPKDSIPEAVSVYQKGVLFRVGQDETLPRYVDGPITNVEHRGLYQKVYEIVTLLESAAFYRGYHLALGLAAGNCRGVFCSDETRCKAMIKGQVCIHPYKSRPSLEAAGIDARTMAKKLGWQGVSETESMILAGLVFVV